MKSTVRRFWLGLASLLLTASFGCGGDGNDVNSQAQADQAVCLKVCLDAKGAFCETYCPPGDGCKLTCDPNAVVLATTNSPGSAGGDKQGSICQWSCPAPGCDPVCDPKCLQQSKQGQTDATMCCKQPTNCPPPPPPIQPPCTGQCDLACLKSLGNQADTATAFAKCCPQNCPPPPCVQQCDPQCMAAMKGAGSNGADPTDLIAKCCKQDCTNPAPNPPPSSTCTADCVAKLMQQGLSAADAKLKCCGQTQPPQPPQPPSTCPATCDTACIDGLVKQGISPDQAKLKCCGQPNCDPNQLPGGQKP